MSSPRLPIILLADNIRSLYNVGALFRVADGVNLEGLYLCGLTGYPKMPDDSRPAWVAERANKEIRKTGLAGVEAVPWRYFATTLEAIEAAKQAGYQIVALELTPDSQDYRTVPYRFPVAVIIGHETAGVDDAVLTKADLTVHLPMRGAGQSLNVATAAAGLLYYLESLPSPTQGVDKALIP